MKKIFILLLMVFGLKVNSSAYTTTTSETLRVWFDPITLVADGETIAYLTVYENDILNYSAFNMAFVVPEGIHIAMVKKGRDLVEDIELSDRASSTHSIACNMLDDGKTIKVICDSSMLDDLYPDDVDGNQLDELYRIGLIADPEMENGTYNVEMLDIKFVLSTADACIPAQMPFVGSFTITGGKLSSIEDISTDYPIEEKVYYDLQGRKIEGNPTPGIYICNGEKVVVK